MRKVLSWVLVLAMVLGSFSMAFAGSYPDTKGAACDDAVNVLSSLGVVNGYEDGSYKPEKVVTRAEASKLIIAALGLTSYATGSKANFTDLAGYDWASGFIGYAQSLGVLKGDGNGKFRPGDAVNYNEMATIIVRALGYTDASLPGTWPANYVSKAKTLGIMDDITGGGGATGANRGDVAIMIYNALNLGIGTIDKDNNWNADSSLVEGTTVYKDTMYIRLGVKSSTDASIIKDTDADDAATDIRDYVGAYATTLNNKDGDIISLDDVKSTFLTGKWNGTKFEANDVEYSVTSDGSYKEAVAMFDNGEYTTDSALTMSQLFQTLTSDVTIAAKVSGKTIKALYSVLQWTPDEAKVVEASDIEDIDDNELLGVDFAKDDNDEIDMAKFQLNGVASLSEITKDHVVYVYEGGMSGKITRVDVGPDKITGDITKKTSTKVTINGTAYKLADKAPGFDIGTCDAGDTVDAYLAFNNKIYKMEKSSSNADNYAVVLKTGKDADAFGTYSYQAKLFLADGTDKVFKVDSDLFKTDLVANVTQSGDWIIQNATKSAINVIKYGLNSDGEIDSLELVATYNNGSTAKDVTASGYYDGFGILSDATIFTADLDAADMTKADNYAVSSLDKIKDTDSVKAAYNLNSNKKIEVMITDGGSSKDDVYGVVTAAAKTGSSDYSVDLLIDGEAKADVASTKSYTDLDAADYQKLYKVTYSTAGKATLGDVTYTEDVAEISSTKLFAKQTTGGAVSKVSSNVAYENGEYLCTLSDNVVVYKWNATDECYEKSSTSKIAGYNGLVDFVGTDKDEKGVVTVVLLYPAA